MKLFFLTLVVFGTVLLGMSVGVIFGNRRIRGSCGGASHMDRTHGKMTCDVCSADRPHCNAGDDQQATTSLCDERVES
jgi:hypothetical protein